MTDCVVSTLQSGLPLPPRTLTKEYKNAFSTAPVLELVEALLFQVVPGSGHASVLVAQQFLIRKAFMISGASGVKILQVPAKAKPWTACRTNLLGQNVQRLNCTNKAMFPGVFQ